MVEGMKIKKENYTNKKSSKFSYCFVVVYASGRSHDEVYGNYCSTLKDDSAMAQMHTHKHTHLDTHVN